MGERICFKSHKAGGDAAESEFLLNADCNAIENCSAFTAMALQLDTSGRSRLIVKATVGLDHGGGEVVKADSRELRVLEAFVRRVTTIRYVTVAR